MDLLELLKAAADGRYGMDEDEAMSLFRQAADRLAALEQKDILLTGALDKMEADRDRLHRALERATDYLGHLIDHSPEDKRDNTTWLACREALGI